MNQYDGILALDLDGVIADTYVSTLRHQKVHIVPDEIKVFKWKYSDMIGYPNLSKHDIDGVQIDSARLISYMIEQCNLAVVVVSSWVSNPEAYKQIAQLFKHLDPNLNMDRFIGQTSGCGGTGRETAFLDFVRENFDKDDPKRIVIVDDSGDKHFPNMVDNTVAPNGRIGFTVDNGIEMVRVLELKSSPWWKWSFNGHMTITQNPKDYKELWAEVFSGS